MTGSTPVSGDFVITDRPATEWRRLSPRMLLVHPVIELGRALPALAGLLVAGTTSGGGSRWSLAGAGVVIVLAISRWFTTRFRITPDQILLRRGLLRRVTMTAPLDRIRTVDVTAHPLHRALGLARVVIGTGVSDRKQRGGIVLDGLDAAEAAHLRHELLHRAVAGAPAESGERELVRFERSWIRYAPFTLSGAVTGLALLGVGWRVVSEGHIHLRRVVVLRRIADQLERWPDVVSAGLVLLAVAVFVAAASTAGYVLAFWRFRLTRDPRGTLHVTRGLLTTRATTIEGQRLLGVSVSRPLLLRSAGGARCLAIATGLRAGRGAERGGEILVPPAPEPVVRVAAAGVLGTREPFDAALRAHPAAARRRRLTRAVASGALLGGLLALLALIPDVPGWWVGTGALVLVGSVPLGRDRYRALGHELVGTYLVTRHGSLNRRRDVLDRRGIIGWNFRSSWFQRRAGLSTLVATTAAGRQHYRVIDLTTVDAEALADAAVPDLLSQFQVPS